jgi:hypothetical protein
VVGHIVFSPVTISDGAGDRYGSGPLPVLPAYQHRGIGRASIEEGLSRLKGLGARGGCLVGHPDYYRRSGFGNAPGLVLEGVPPEVLFALSIDGHLPKGPSPSTTDSRPMGDTRGGADERRCCRNPGDVFAPYQAFVINRSCRKSLYASDST